MAVRFYDEALVKKLKYWTSNTQVKIYSPAETRKLFEVIADETNDSPIKLPIICVRRQGGYTVKETGRKPLAYSGKEIGKTEQKVCQLNAIPIELKYQIDVYTRYYDEADEFVRNLVFNIINFPSVTACFNYLGEEVQHNSTIELSQEIEDNSDIPERFVAGNFTRLSLQVTMPNAYLWDVRVKDTSSVEGYEVEAEDPIQEEVEEHEQLDGKGIIIREKE